jgi:hypothetical protein
MTCKCSTNEHNHQPFPLKRQQLAVNMNLPLGVLRERFGSDQSTVYSYIVDSIRNQEGHFVQTGCGPNFQGDFITLCTCKGRMRTYRPHHAWKGIWIAGFTNLTAGGNRNALAYLMKVLHSFESHFDLWYSAVIPEKSKQIKNARLNELGDVYEPKPESVRDGQFNAQSYYTPHPNHPHAADDRWHEDIDYIGYPTGLPPALLVGDPQHSFLWNKPVMFYPSHHPRTQKCKLGELLNQLKVN